MTDRLVAFLRARLDDDEAVAREATQGDWVWSREFVTPPGYHHRTVGPLEPGDARHIARHDPPRVLADVEAKRRILDLHELTWRDLTWLDGGDEYQDEIPVCGHCVPRHAAYPTRQDIPEGPCTTVCLLAAAYADEPGYCSEWTP